MTLLVVLTVVDIVLLVAGLAIYLFIVGSQLTRIAGVLEDCDELVGEIVADAEPIVPGVAHINSTGGVVASALPLLYGMAEGIVVGATFDPSTAHAERQPAVPASGRRRSRLHDGVGYDPERVPAAG
jgi:hypothetical protein